MILELHLYPYCYSYPWCERVFKNTASYGVTHQLLINNLSVNVWLTAIKFHFNTCLCD